MGDTGPSRGPVRTASASLLDPVARYYTEKLARFGATPLGVDWKSTEAQETRFAQLCRLFGDTRSFSLNDVGCGYGALYDYLADRGFEVDYRGYDVSEAMLEAARGRARTTGRPRFFAGGRPAEAADYSVASGIFNVRLDAPSRAWVQHVHATLDDLSRASRRGFAFNCLTSHADPERKRDDLFYADPAVFLNLCLTRFSRRVSLLHDYGLFEFTSSSLRRPRDDAPGRLRRGPDRGHGLVPLPARRARVVKMLTVDGSRLRGI